MNTALARRTSTGNKVALYVRVSTDDQHSSVDNQQQLFTSRIEREKWILHKTYTDEGISGTKSDKRICYQQLIEDGKNGDYDILLAKSYSRFGRNQRETLQAIADLMQAGVRIIFLEDNLDSMKDYNQFGLFAWLAETEARKTSERIKAVWKHFDEIGRIHVPKPPYGYAYDPDIKNYVVIPEEKDIVLNIFRMYLSGMGGRGIAIRLNEDNVPTQKGGKWSQPTISAMLTNFTYIGCLVQGKTETIDVTMKKSKKKDISDWKIHRDNHEPIIPIEMFYKVQEEIKRRSRKIKENARPTRHSNSALFSTVIKCKECGTTCTVKRQKHFRNYSPYYSCIAYEQRGKKGCGHERVSIFEETLIQLIQGEVKHLVESNYLVIREAFDKVKETRKPKNSKANLRAIEEAIQEKGQLSMTLLTAYSKKIIQEAQFQLQNEMIEKDLQRLYKERDEIQRELNTFDIKIDKEQEVIDAVNTLANVDPNEWTNQMIKAVIDKITIDSKKNVEIYLRYQADTNTPMDEIAVTCDERCDTCDKCNQHYQNNKLSDCKTVQVGSVCNKRRTLIYQVLTDIITLPRGRYGQALDANIIKSFKLYI